MTSTPAGLPVSGPGFQLDPATLALYQPAGAEDFRGMRGRFDNQETAIFGPLRRQRQQQAVPYQERPPPPQFPDDAATMGLRLTATYKYAAFVGVHLLTFQLDSSPLLLFCDPKHAPTY